METPIQAEPQKSNTGSMIGIGAIVVVVLLCCCVVVVIAVLMLLGPSVGKVFSSINEGLTTPMPAFPIAPATPDLSGVPTISPDVIPKGGKGDEFQRTIAWGYVLIAAGTDGCSYNLKALDTKIKVIQEADSKGVWKEAWTVTCDDGSQKAYNVTFTPSAGGGTDITVTSGQ
jgi:Flp pilus assembly pilin Flp